MSPLLERMHKVRKRILLQRWLRHTVDALLAGAAVSCVWLVLTRLFPVIDLGIEAYGAILFLSIVAGTYRTFRGRPGLLQAALETDRRLGLKERLTSSLELDGLDGEMVRAVHEDALQHAQRLDVNRAFPIEPPRNLRWLLVPILLLGLGFVFLPEFDLFGFKARQVEAKALDEAKRVQAERIKEAARPLREESEKISAADLANMATEIERVAEELASGQITEKQMLAKLTNLGENLEQQREKLQSTSALPQLAKDVANLDSTQEMAKAILNGELGKAAEKAREMKEKLSDPSLSEAEKQKLAEEMKKLSDALKSGEMNQNSALSEALAKAAAALSQASSEADSQNSGDQGQQAVQMSMEDVASILEQLDKLNDAMKEMAKMQAEQLGSSEFCRSCGTSLKQCQSGDKNCKSCGAGTSCSGMCSSCASGNGWCKGGKFGAMKWRAGDSSKPGDGGMGGGRGRGNTTGPLPDTAADFVPTVAPGEVTKGKMLADIVQKTAPDQEAESTAEFISGQIQQEVQQMEQAITREEIPLGSREMIRQYFGSIDPDQPNGTAPATAAGQDDHGHDAEAP